MDVNVTLTGPVAQFPSLGQSPKRRSSEPPRSRIRVSVTLDASGLAIRLAGELDTYTVSALSRRLRPLDPGSTVSVDLMGVRLIDSSGGCFLAGLVAQLLALGCDVDLVIPDHLERTLGVFGLA